MKTAQPVAFGVVAVLLCGIAHAQPPDWAGRYTELCAKNLGNQPAAYTRYYEKLKAEVQENVCEDQK